MILASDLCRARPAPRHGCQCGLTADRKLWTGSGGSAGMSSGRYVWDPRNTRRDVVAKSRDPDNNLTFLYIPVNPPYLKHPDPILNELGLEQKDYYMTCDVCKVLSIKPDTFRQRKQPDQKIQETSEEGSLQARHYDPLIDGPVRIPEEKFQELAKIAVGFA